MILLEIHLQINFFRDQARNDKKLCTKFQNFCAHLNCLLATESAHQSNESEMNGKFKF